MGKNILIIGLLVDLTVVLHLGLGSDSKYNWEIIETLIQIILAAFTCLGLCIAAKTYHDTNTPKCKIHINDIPVFVSNDLDSMVIEIPIIIMNAGTCPFSIYDIFLQGEQRYKHPLALHDYKLPYLINSGAAMSLSIPMVVIEEAKLGTKPRLVVRTSYGEEIRYFENFVSNGEAKG